MSGDFKTTKPACSTLFECKRFSLARLLRIVLATDRLDSIDADWDRSSNIFASWLSLSSKLSPPIRSTEFSLFANHLAASLVAPFWDKT